MALLLLVDLNDNNDNDKRLGLTAKADQPDHKKIRYTKNKMKAITLLMLDIAIDK